MNQRINIAHDTHVEQLLYTIESSMDDLIAYMQRRRTDFSAYEETIGRIESRATDVWLAATQARRNDELLTSRPATDFGYLPWVIALECEYQARFPDLDMGRGRWLLDNQIMAENKFLALGGEL